MADNEDSQEIPASQIPPDEDEVTYDDGSEENIKVAVRIRPLNAREKQKESKVIVKVQGNSLWLTDPAKNADKKFEYDFVYQSFDANNCATNEDIFKDLGHMFVDNAFEGYNVKITNFFFFFGSN
ncbi:hypothetical protein RFI_30552 [Reticulomyxa filosa]|uniref:Kinesin motor domain-containing protein n=1 Tax=Reticulomyxa filosa TaxID=46433 RepID=X6M1I2_RETFI|nr:hypothetical protein RFI_30552 [Reticulomyxa filosa]|eukprot:ETO06840.1 hypothetical protein RFI_30552 [Reticulomyxa filosa]